jgi:hypothetical protein
MSRARNIKPGFFKNEVLAECDPLARILFAGLWCEADRDGRLEDRPKRLKAEYLAYDECDADDLLAQLASRGFISRYVVDDKRFIAILAFGLHQNPHVKEAPSKIPAPCEHSASTVQAQETPIPTGLIPSSLIPDSPSLIPEVPPSAAQPKAFDFKKALFDRWKALDDGGGGAFLSKLFKDHKPEQRVVEAVERTLDETRADPKAFVLGVLRGGAESDYAPGIGMSMNDAMRIAIATHGEDAG